jgi:hypothetical protein
MRNLYRYVEVMDAYCLTRAVGRCTLNQVDP